MIRPTCQTLSNHRTQAGGSAWRGPKTVMSLLLYITL